jgi:haloalkane dehalogenase
MKTYPWLDKQLYPFSAHYFDLNGQKLHYLDEGKGDALVFIHGTPTWSFMYRDLIKGLRQNYRCLALDHLGFGLSDKPKNYPYSAQKHAENLENWLNSLNLENFTLIIHDFGGVLGFNYALKYPEKIKNLIVFNTFLWSSEGEPKFEKFKKILKNPVLPFLYRYFNFSARFILPKGFEDKKKLSKTLHQHYLKPFSKVSEREGTLGFVKALLNEQAWFNQLWQERAKLLDKEILLLWGMKDEFLTEEYLEKIKHNFSHSQVHTFADCGHFVPEEIGDALVPIFQDFLQPVKIKA